jgi:DNA topoisomerase 2-associated protein PAT1
LTLNSFCFEILSKSVTALNNLHGALGKTAGRSYKAAPRQLLQVDANGTSPEPSIPSQSHISKADVAADVEGAAQKAAEIGHEALHGHVSDGQIILYIGC